jgi:hypothetical protein
VPAAERRDQWPEKVNFPDADRVEPNDSSPGAIGNAHAAGKFWQKVFPIPSGTDGSPHEPRRQHAEDEEVSEV